MVETRANTSSLRHIRVLAVVVSVASVAGLSTAQAQEDTPPPIGAIEIDPFVEPFPLEIGPWTATASAFGVAEASEQGFTIWWGGRIPAQFEFAIVDDGTATGRWQHQGNAVQKLTGTAGGQALTATGFIEFTGGGTVAGNNSQLTLRGRSTTTGSVVASTSAGTIAIPVSGTNDLPTLRLDVAATSCDEAYGEWAYTVVQGFEGEGFEADFGGYWNAIRNSEEINANTAELIQAARVDPTTENAPDLISSSPLMGMSAAILREYNAFVDEFPGWTLDRVLDIGSRTEALLAAMRNLTECDKRLFGEDNVEVFIDGLTFLLQGLIIGSPTASYTSHDFQNLVHIAVRNGALGPGAPNPAQAVNAETALIRAGQAILEANVDPSDNRIFVNEDTRRVMATGAAMGWNFTVGGATFNARETYEYILGDTWQESAPTGGDGE